MTELDEHWKAGYELGGQLIAGFKERFPASRHLFVLGETPFGVDEALGWLFFQGWYVEYRARALIDRLESASVRSNVESYLSGFGDALHFELSEGRDPLSERDKAVFKAFDDVRAKLRATASPFLFRTQEKIPIGLQFYALALETVCSEKVAEVIRTQVSGEGAFKRIREFLDIAESLLESLVSRIAAEGSSTVPPGSLWPPFPQYSPVRPLVPPATQEPPPPAKTQEPPPPAKSEETIPSHQGSLSPDVHASSGWPRLSEQDLRQLTPEERQFIRDLEEMGIGVESLAAQDIILNCLNKFQFAKTYVCFRWACKIFTDRQQSSRNIVRTRRIAIQAA